MTEAPRAVQTAIRQFGGTNRYGRPIWRVVLAQDQIVKRGGIFIERGEGDIQTIKFEPQPGGGYKQVYVPVPPKSVRNGVLEVPKYPVRGWILERWWPPHMFGDKETWERLKGQDGFTPLMGPFPSEGDYWFHGGPWEQIPQTGDILNAIAMWEKGIAEYPADFEAYLNSQIREQQDAEEKAYQRLVNELEKYCKSEIAPIFNSTSLEAQRVRNEVQQARGQKSHLGAGQL
jgi:hypothetical protein